MDAKETHPNGNIGGRPTTSALPYYMSQVSIPST